ncbi:MAG: zinc-ribbon domain-containing protein [Acidobacteriota bacterium]
MTGFCTKCGTPLNEGMAFCTKCGAAAGAAAASAGPAAYTPPVSNTPAAYTPPVSSPSSYTPPAYTPVGAAPPQKSGSSAVKIILIIVAVFVGLGILTVGGIMFGIYRVSRAVHVSDNGKGVELSTPAGSFSAGDTAVSASDLGVDLYPGASQQKGAVRINTPKGSMITAVFETSDPLDKVMGYYKDKLGTGASVFQSDKGAVLTLADETKKTNVMVTIGANDSDGKTAITITHSVGS